MLILTALLSLHIQGAIGLGPIVNTPNQTSDTVTSDANLRQLRSLSPFRKSIKARQLYWTVVPDMQTQECTEEAPPPEVGGEHNQGNRYAFRYLSDADSSKTDVQCYERQIINRADSQLWVHWYDRLGVLCSTTIKPKGKCRSYDFGMLGDLIDKPVPGKLEYGSWKDSPADTLESQAWRFTEELTPPPTTGEPEWFVSGVEADILGREGTYSVHVEFYSEFDPETQSLLIRIENLGSIPITLHGLDKVPPIADQPSIEWPAMEIPAYARQAKQQLSEAEIPSISPDGVLDVRIDVAENAELRSGPVTIYLGETVILTVTALVYMPRG